MGQSTESCLREFRKAPRPLALSIAGCRERLVESAVLVLVEVEWQDESGDELRLD